MDAWNPDQLKRMQAGGNAKLNAFLETYGVTKHTDIKEKYNSKGAEFYREKIRAEIDGKSYTPPPPSAVRSTSMPRPKSYGGPRTASNDWDDWGADGGSSPITHAASSNAINGVSNGNGKSEYTMSQLQASAAQKEDFFSRKMAENSSRPEGIPPSQGGKYVGFGSTPAPTSRPSGGHNVDDMSEMFSKGLSGLGALAGQAAQVAKEKAAQANVALKDAGVTETLGQTASVAAEKTKEYGSKGWSILKTAYAAAASTIEQTAAQNGYKVDLGSKKVADSARLGGVGQYSQVGGAAPAGYDGFGEDDGWSSRQNGGNGMHGGGGSFSGFDDEYDSRRDFNSGSNGVSAARAPAPQGNGRSGNGEWSGWEEAVSPSGGKQEDEWGKW